jgi:hypothetical protein
MGWFEDWKERLRAQYRARSIRVEKEATELEEKLEGEKGLGAAVLRGIYKSATFLSTKWIEGIRKVSPGTIENFDALISGEMLEVPTSVWEINIDRISKGLGLSSAEVGQLKAMHQTLEGVSPIVRGLSVILLYTNIIQFLAGPAMGKMQQTLLSRFRPVAPQPGAVMGARGLDPNLDKQIWSVLERNGIKESDIELMFAATYQRYSVGEARNMFYRGILTEDGLNHRLTEMGFTPERISELKQVFPTIPGIQDLIMMQAKEAFEPALISKYGLGAEEPTDIYQWTRKLGLSDEWTQKYWSSHWQHPSMNQVMEMLWRTDLTLDDVWNWYKLVEIPPFWRNYLTEIAYHPYTRVDVRRMHAQGVLDDTDLIKAMTDIGYDQEHAEKMAEFYKKYNTRAEKDLSRADIEKAYEDGDLSEGDALYLLGTIGYDAELSAFYLRRVDLEKQRAVRLERIQLTKEKFLSSLITESQARNELVSYGVQVPRINELIERWVVQIIKNAKLPSKTDLDKFVRSKVIDQDGYTVEMMKLGYSEYYISLYWKHLQAGGAIE